MLLTDRTRIEADWTCPRKRYWLTEYQRTGIVPANQPTVLTFGIVVHEGLEHLTTHDDWEAAVTHMKSLTEWGALDQDQQWLARAQVIGFAVEVWPAWKQQYEKVALEQELEFEHHGVLYMVRPDVLLRDRKTGDLWYPDYKTFSGWTNRKWSYALQQQLTIVACERATGEKIVGSWIQGLSKGTTRNGRLYHPLVYAYRKAGSPGLYVTQYATKRKAGFERYPTVQFTDGSPSKAIHAWALWVKKHDPDVLSNLFPRTAPIFVKAEMMQAFLEQRTKREKEIAAATARIELFPQTFSACESTYGTCPYLDACWVPTVTRDPIGRGYYVPREPHHAAETTVFKTR